MAGAVAAGARNRHLSLLGRPKTSAISPLQNFHPYAVRAYGIMVRGVHPVRNALVGSKPICGSRAPRPAHRAARPPRTALPRPPPRPWAHDARGPERTGPSHHVEVGALQSQNASLLMQRLRDDAARMYPLPSGFCHAGTVHSHTATLASAAAGGGQGGSMGRGCTLPGSRARRLYTCAFAGG